MKIKSIFWSLLFLLGSMALQAQQKTTLPIKEAVQMALEKSHEAALANARVSTKKYQYESVKNNRYPDGKLSGQYMRLTDADVTIKTTASSNNSSNSGASKPVNQLMLAQANVSMPIFSGFKLQNSIDAAQNLYLAENAMAKGSNENTAMSVIRHYAAIYNKQQTVDLLEESLKSNQQRVQDFTAMEQNGLLARNDLLKSQLQVSKVQLSLDQAQKDLKMLRFELAQLLQLDPATEIYVSPENIDPKLFTYLPKPANEALNLRSDLTALDFEKKAGTSNVKVARSAYYPSLLLSGGYIYLDLQNAIRVENAMNFGLGLSYNLSSLFKNGTEVKAAKSKLAEIEKQQAQLSDEIKTEIKNAQENYELAQKQDRVYAESVTQATENYRIVKDKYDNGLANTNDLLEADVDQLSAKINLANAKANVALKYYEWLHSTGQLLETFQDTQK
ncbi:MAG: TolC family protein [Bacteroidetes bacterium]|nr:TolC family protein [Bacteroidota bacterium]